MNKSMEEIVKVFKNNSMINLRASHFNHHSVGAVAATALMLPLSAALFAAAAL